MERLREQQWVHVLGVDVDGEYFIRIPCVPRDDMQSVQATRLQWRHEGNIVRLDILR